MTLTIACPSCRQPIQVHPASAGQVFACPHCQQPFTVPAAHPRNEFDTFDQEDTGSSRRRRKANTPSGLLVGVVVGSVVGLLVLVGGGVATYLMLSGARDDSTKGTADDSATGKVATVRQPADKATRKLPPPTPSRGGDEEWAVQVRAELAIAASAQRVQEPVRGKFMTQAEYQVAEQSLDGYRTLYPTDAPDGVQLRVHFIHENPATSIMPETTRVTLREAFTLWATKSDDELERAINVNTTLRPLLDMEFRAELRARLPWKERKELYAKFAETAGLKEKWSLLVPFDELSGREMKEAVAAVQKADKDGLRALAGDERRLLLRAGALRYVEVLLSHAFDK